jgi:membrane fusion protein, heavy metal efflux system
MNETTKETMNPRMKIIGAIGGVLVVAAGCFLWGRSAGHAGVAAAAAPMAAAPAVDDTAAAANPGVLTLPARAAAENPVTTAPVGLVKLAGDIQLVGTVSYDQDHLAFVGPLVAGRIARLAAGVGDHVTRGQVLAEIESADVGQARADLIAARARAAAAQMNLRRETDLAERRISSAREKEVAEAQWITESAAVRAATERLRALGLSNADLAAEGKQDLGGRLPVRAPIDGVVLQRTVTLGQAVERATDAFKIADIGHVWIDLDLYEKDLPYVNVGERVEIRADAYPAEVFKGRVAYVVPVVDEATRTAKVRVELLNPNGKLSFGQLVTARLVGDPANVAVAVLAVPRAAIQRVDGRSVVFVRSQTKPDDKAQDGPGFERRVVELGVSTGDQVEIRRGIKEGELVASDGAFLLKSELLR